MKKCLIVVDYQNDFVTGSLGFKKAEQLDDRIADKIVKYRADGWEVVFTFDGEDEDAACEAVSKFMKENL